MSDEDVPDEIALDAGVPGVTCDWVIGYLRRVKRRPGFTRFMMRVVFASVAVVSVLGNTSNYFVTDPS